MGLGGTGAVMLVAGVPVLVVAVRGIVRTVQEAVVARLPWVPRQGVLLQTAGTYVLHLEGPSLSRVMLAARHLGPATPSLTLLDPALGTEAPRAPSFGRARVGGLRTTRIAVRRYRIARSGSYEVVAGALPAGTDAAPFGVVVAGAYEGRMVGWILATVAGGLLAVGGLVLLIIGAALG